MLTIQPNFTQRASQRLAFKGENDFITDEKYNEKKAYYQNQVQEFDTLIKDDYIPDKLKKPLKYGKILAGSLLEGWAVFWAANKGAGFIKNSFIKSANSKLANEIGDIAKPAKKGIKDAGKKLADSISKKFGHIKDSKFMTNLAEKIDKLDKTRVGHVLVAGVKAVGHFIAKVAKAVVSPFKKITYDKTAHAASTTLGVGCGVAGAYNELRTDENNKAAKTAEDVDNNKIETERLEDEELVEGEE